MEIRKKIQVDKQGLEQWLDRMIADGLRVFAPVRSGAKVDVRQIVNASEVADDYIQTIQSVKRFAFPKSEELFSYRKGADGVELKEQDVDALPETIAWKVRPCDAAGFTPLGGIFNWDYKDKPFNARRAKLTLISFSCTQSDDACFCTSVGGGPGNTAGSDIQVTELSGQHYLVEAITEKGEAMVGKYLQDAATADDVDKEQYLAKIPVHFNVKELFAKLGTAFDSPIWKQQSERCLGCGACAFVCPTCACFDIQEDAKGSSGKRIRCWDSCGFSLFTLHTSGHNPRPTQSTRWRQRILHKFLYMPDRLAVTGCTGCGRCSRACPVDMNILEHLQSITDHD